MKTVIDFVDFGQKSDVFCELEYMVLIFVILF